MAHEGQRTTDARAKAGAQPGVSRRAGTDARQRICSVAPPSVTSDAGPAPIPSVRWADVARAGPGQHAAMGIGSHPGARRRSASLRSARVRHRAAGLGDRKVAGPALYVPGTRTKHRTATLNPDRAAVKRPETTSG